MVRGGQGTPLICFADAKRHSGIAVLFRFRYRDKAKIAAHAAPIRATSPSSVLRLVDREGFEPS